MWIDLEMSGLDVEACRILEIAAIVTDYSFRPLDPSFHCIVKQDQAVLDAMDEWCTKTHGESGLSAAVPNGVEERQAEQNLLAFLSPFFKADEQIILCGNSIGQDRKFIDRYLPHLSTRLHYRMLDVTSFKIAFPTLGHPLYEKKGTHRALDDIRESIAELKHFLQMVKPVVSGQ